MAHNRNHDLLPILRWYLICPTILAYNRNYMQFKLLSPFLLRTTASRQYSCSCPSLSCLNIQAELIKHALQLLFQTISKIVFSFVILYWIPMPFFMSRASSLQLFLAMSPLFYNLYDWFYFMHFYVHRTLSFLGHYDYISCSRSPSWPIFRYMIPTTMLHCIFYCPSWTYSLLQLCIIIMLAFYSSFDFHILCVIWYGRFLVNALHSILLRYYIDHWSRSHTWHSCRCTSYSTSLLLLHRSTITRNCCYMPLCIYSQTIYLDHV